MKKYSGKELYRLQQENGMSEYELAEHLGTSRSIIHGVLYHYKKKNNLLGQRAKNPETVIKQDKDNLDITHMSAVRSLESLIEAFEIDESVWQVKSFVAEKWDSATDQTEKFLIKASFERVKNYQKPIAPIQIVIEEREKPKKHISRDEHKRTLALFDIHFGFRRDIKNGNLSPFHNRNALSVALQIADEMKPDTIVFGGDFLDMSEWSDKFTLEPEFYFTTQSALIECAWWMANFADTCWYANVVAMSGNHEDRMKTLISKRVAALAPLRTVDNQNTFAASIDNLLGLSRRTGFKYIEDYPSGEYLVCDDTVIQHGSVIRSKPGHTAAAVVEQSTRNIVFGHKHTIERASRTVELVYNRPTVISAVCGGCLCRTDGFVPGSSKNKWQNGIVEIVHSERQAHAINQILISKDETLYEGKAFVADEKTILAAAKSIANIF